MKTKLLGIIAITILSIAPAGCQPKTIYTAGGYMNSGGKDVACYWKGKTRTDLTDGTTASVATAITILGGKVYTAGNYINSDVKTVACYWEGVTKTDLSDGTTDVEATGIFVQ